MKYEVPKMEIFLFYKKEIVTVSGEETLDGDSTPVGGGETGGDDNFGFGSM